MSRIYDVEIEVNNVSEKKSKAIAEVIEKEAVDNLENFSFTKKEGLKMGQIFCSDQTTLCGGESPEEAHKRITEAIKKVAPKVSVTTRWHYAEWYEWDEIFTDNE